VIDTGVLVSALIRPRGTTGAVLRALRDARFTAIYSTGMLGEVIDVLGREKFHTKYHLELGDITALVNLIRLRGELVVPNRSVAACRDPKDDKFLEVALAGEADCLISGDADLLDMISFQGIPFLRPVEFLARL
jgi:putative PIN family toxin of toxin-antitoxin system